MADAKADKIQSAGVEVAENYDALNFGTGLSATSSDGIVTARIASGYTPSHIVVAAGEFTTVGGDADETISVSGVLATDLVLVNVHTAGGTPRTVVDASASANQIDVDMSGDPSTDHVLTYVVYRAVS